MVGRYDPVMLAPIVAAAEERARALRGHGDRLRGNASQNPDVRPLGAALAGPGLAVIAEIKRRSPSAGGINEGIDVAPQAQAYVAGGAAAVSVLTEPKFFSGSLDDLRTVRSVVDVPVLRKDFVVDPIQIWEARAAGADAVLLIVAVLGADRLGSCLETAAEVGVDALVEVHTEEEAIIAVAAGAAFIGVNNRDLATFTTDLAVAERLRPHLGRNAVTVAESGISGSADAVRMRAAGYDAVLVGEALVRADDPAELVRSLRGSTR
jgi:indole-3-glycerol phosphate synthase